MILHCYFKYSFSIYTNRLTYRQVPDYAKEPGGKENWVQSNKEAPRTDYYEKLYKKVEVKAKSERERISISLDVNVNGEKMKIISVKKDSKMTLAYYLKDKVCKGSAPLMLEALKNLQKEQGYQVDFFPEGYMVEVINNKLSIYKDTGAGREYYKSPDTGVAAKDLWLFDFGGVKQDPDDAARAREDQEPVIEEEEQAPQEEDPVLPPVPLSFVPWPVERDDQEQARNTLGEDVREDLILLTQEDEALEMAGHSIGAILDQARVRLDQLRANYPYDPDIFAFEQAYADLRGDFEDDEEVELDEAFPIIFDEMMAVIDAVGVERRELDAITDASLRSTVASLRALEIEPAYVVESPNPNAKTVVLFLQNHGESPGVDIGKMRVGDISILEGGLDGPEPAMSVEESQSLIRDAMVWAFRAGLIHDAYLEAAPYGVTLKLPPGAMSRDAIETMRLNAITRARTEGIPLEDGSVLRGDEAVAAAESIFQSGGLLARLELGDQFHVHGYDFDEYKMKIFEGEADFVYRINAHHPFIASRFADLMEASSEDIAFMTMGALHEFYLNPAVAHHLPISHVLAYYGLNVVVVDAANESSQ